MALIRLNKLNFDTVYNTSGNKVYGGCEGNPIYLDTSGIVITPIMQDCIFQSNCTNSFSNSFYFIKKKVCSNIGGQIYWQSPEEIQELVRKEERLCQCK